MDRELRAEPRDQEETRRFGEEPELDRAGPDRLDFAARGATEEDPQLVATQAETVPGALRPDLPVGVVGLADFEGIHRRGLRGCADRPARRAWPQRPGGSLAAPGGACRWK